MRNKKIKTGFTLVELLTVVALILLLAVVGLPAAKKVLNSFESSLSVRHVISAALANARAIAAREQTYAGLRFQQDLNGNQYMIFIVNDPDVRPGIPGNLGCRAVAGYKPMKLPQTVGVMDLKIKQDYDEPYPKEHEEDIEVDGNIQTPIQLTDTTTFSILFSPAGKLVLHTLKVGHSSIGADIFNSRDNVENGIGMFIVDQNRRSDEGLQIELSRNNFIIYDKRTFDAVNEDSRWTDYLQHLEALYISPYTGQIINK
ncbi:MAG: prepilin-type N-terminal cleavage/methylation domain-containing protein [Planctomycetota bacterium]|jgi:prepilin-type N-terminal cleavage/methylation domain-containing protein